MGRVAALLAAALASSAAIAACGGDGGAEPGAPEGATLVLDFQPNAVHAPIYAARSRGYLEDAGIDLEIREPSSSADAAKLLQAGRADFAILDINDFGLARERGIDLVAVAGIVGRPLASVIAADPDSISAPADLKGSDGGGHGSPLRRRRARHGAGRGRAGPGRRRAGDDRLRRRSLAGRGQDRGRHRLLERGGG